MNLGERIADLRKRKKWTQTELADKIFVTDKTVSSWELNRTEPGLEVLMKLSELFSCSISYLIYGDIEKSDIETEIKVRLSKEEFERMIAAGELYEYDFEMNDDFENSLLELADEIADLSAKLTSACI